MFVISRFFLVISQKIFVKPAAETTRHAEQTSGEAPIFLHMSEAIAFEEAKGATCDLVQLFLFPVIRFSLFSFFYVSLPLAAAE